MKVSLSESGAIAICCVICFAGESRAVVPGAWFLGLGDLSGGPINSVASDVSADGSTVVGAGSLEGGGFSGGRAFRWTSGLGLQDLGDLPGGARSSFATSVSADGSIVGGHSTTATGVEPFRWTSTSGMQNLNDLSTTGLMGVGVKGVSDDGLVLVGQARSQAQGDSGIEAFRWTIDEGIVALTGFRARNALGISGDGSVIVGHARSPASDVATEAFRWTVASGMHGLGDLPGGYFSSSAYDASFDGTTIVGASHSRSDDSFSRAFRWTEAGGMQALGELPGGDIGSTAWAVSEDGSIVVGQSQVRLFHHRAFIWDERYGMRDLQQVLISTFGLNLDGWTLTSATGISADGRTIVGYGINPSGRREAWIAVLIPEPAAILLAMVGSAIASLIIARRRPARLQL